MIWMVIYLAHLLHGWMNGWMGSGLTGFHVMNMIMIKGRAILHCKDFGWSEDETTAHVHITNDTKDEHTVKQYLSFWPGL